MLVIAQLVDIDKFFSQTTTSTFFPSKMKFTNLNLSVAAYVPLQNITFKNMQL